METGEPSRPVASTTVADDSSDVTASCGRTAATPPPRVGATRGSPMAAPRRNASADRAELPRHHRDLPLARGGGRPVAVDAATARTASIFCPSFSP
jgi:hypothetical protein